MKSLKDRSQTIEDEAIHHRSVGIAVQCLYREMTAHKYARGEPSGVSPRILRFDQGLH
jgi:hypothetical protein